MARNDDIHSRTGAERDRRQDEAAGMGQRQAEQVQSIMGASARALQSVSDTSRVDVEAMMQSSTRLARGLQEVGWEVMHFTQDSIRRGLRVANDMMECRSVEDYVDVQREFMRETLEELMNESAKLLNLSSQVAADAVDPLNHRAAEADDDEDEPADDQRRQASQGRRRRN